MENDNLTQVFYGDRHVISRQYAAYCLARDGYRLPTDKAEHAATDKLTEEMAQSVSQAWTGIPWSLT